MQWWRLLGTLDKEKKKGKEDNACGVLEAPHVQSAGRQAEQTRTVLAKLKVYWTLRRLVQAAGKATLYETTRLASFGVKFRTV